MRVTRGSCIALYIYTQDMEHVMRFFVPEGLDDEGVGLLAELPRHGT